MRIVARAALPAVRILGLVEVRKDLPHLVAAETLRGAGDERLARGVSRSERWHIGCELMTNGAVTNSLARHLREGDGGFPLIVTSALPASLLHGLEVMELTAVTVDASQVLERARIGFEVHAMSCCSCDPLPCRGILRDVTRFADAIGHVGVFLDLFRPLGNPHVKLMRAGEH